MPLATAEERTDQLAERDALIFPTTAQASLRATTSALLALARESRALDPSIFEEEGSDPFFWSAQCSSNVVDAYATIMQPSSLRNYAADAVAGIAFQNSHLTRELPLGQSLTGRYVGAQGNGQARFEADFYTIPGLGGTITTDQLRRGMRAGVYRDVSIGFYGGRTVCSICGNDMLDGWAGLFADEDRDLCWHIPGMQYEVKDPNTGKKTGDTVTAYGLIEDARLAEVSQVYDGATPGAQLKAIRMAEAGHLSPAQARAVEARHRIHLPGTERRHPGVRGNSGDGLPGDAASPSRSTPKEGTAVDESTHTSIDLPTTEPPTTEAPDSRATTPTAAASEPDTLAIALERDSLRNRLEAVRALVGAAADADLDVHLRALVAEAVEGRQYRADLIEQTLAEGVRAHGTAFAAEDYRELLKGASLERIKAVKAGFSDVAQRLFPGGRVAVDTVQPPSADGETLRSANPPAAYVS